MDPVSQPGKHSTRQKLRTRLTIRITRHLTRDLLVLSIIECDTRTDQLVAENRCRNVADKVNIQQKLQRFPGIEVRKCHRQCLIVVAEHRAGNAGHRARIIHRRKRLARHRIRIKYQTDVTQIKHKCLQQIATHRRIRQIEWLDKRVTLGPKLYVSPGRRTRRHRVPRNHQIIDRRDRVASPRVDNSTGHHLHRVTVPRSDTRIVLDTETIGRTDLTRYRPNVQQNPLNTRRSINDVVADQTITDVGPTSRRHLNSTKPAALNHQRLRVRAGHQQVQTMTSLRRVHVVKCHRLQPGHTRQINVDPQTSPGFHNHTVKCQTLQRNPRQIDRDPFTAGRRQADPLNHQPVEVVTVAADPVRTRHAGVGHHQTTSQVRESLVVVLVDHQSIHREHLPLFQRLQTSRMLSSGAVDSTHAGRKKISTSK